MFWDDCCFPRFVCPYEICARSMASSLVTPYCPGIQSDGLRSAPSRISYLWWDILAWVVALFRVVYVFFKVAKKQTKLGFCWFSFFYCRKGIENMLPCYLWCFVDRACLFARNDHQVNICPKRIMKSEKGRDTPQGQIAHSRCRCRRSFRMLWDSRVLKCSPDCHIKVN